MAQKFTNLEEAATQLGVSKERLNQLREAGKLRAYRDGASWKFRSDDVDKLARDGIPQIDPGASDLALDLDDDSPSVAPSGLELELSDAGAASGPASDLNLDEIDEPTVAGIEEDESDALAINLDDDEISLSDSILLTEADLGASPGRPPSTIIGRAELDADADLDLSPVDKAESPVSDVQLAPGSDILRAGDDDFADLPSPSGDFAGLDELEIDLEAESSRILSPSDVAKARSAAAKKPAETSDLELAPSDSDAARAASDIGLASDAASGTGLTGLSALELEDDDDQVLGEGSDVTLSGESSGINIISPSDSGLALDEVALDLSGSTPMGSALDLGEISAADSAVGAAGSKVGEDFQLTPIGEEGADDDKDSSQVIALDELSEESAGTPLGAAVSDSGMLTEDFGVGLAPGAVVVADATADTPFSMWNVMGLASCLLLLGLCGMMLYDLLRNMWSFEQGVSGTSSTLLEVLNPFL
jgi:excisionase family DNA binding protein